jgi:hypothetical protein
MYGNLVTYINNTAASGAALASNTIAGLSKMSVTPASGSNPVAVGDNDPRILSTAQFGYVASITNSGIPYVVATGSSTAYTATLASAYTALASGQALNFLVPATNATGITLNVNSQGAKPIVKNYNTTLASGDIVQGQIVGVGFDGANYQMLSPVKSSITIVNSGQTTYDMSTASGTQTIAHGLGVVPKLVHLTALAPGPQAVSYSHAVITSGTTSKVTLAWEESTGTQTAAIAFFQLYGSLSGSTYITGVVTVDATNISIAWTKFNSPSGTAQLIWDAIA